MGCSRGCESAESVRTADGSCQLGHEGFDAGMEIWQFSLRLTFASHLGILLFFSIVSALDMYIYSILVNWFSFFIARTLSGMHHPIYFRMLTSLSFFPIAMCISSYVRVPSPPYLCPISLQQIFGLLSALSPSSNVLASSLHFVRHS
jgi:hypothetical protein